MDQHTNHSAELMNRNRLIFATGQGNASGAERAELDTRLLDFKETFERKWALLRSPDEKKRCKRLLQKLLDNAAERRKLRHQLGAAVVEEIKATGQLRVFSEDVDDEQMRIIAMFSTFPSMIEDVENVEDQNIRHLIQIMNENSKKGAIRVAVVEPFLTFLQVHNLTTNLQPMTDVMKVLFDWLNIEQKYRPTDPGLRTIMHEHRREFANINVNAYKNRMKTVLRRLKTE